VERDHKRERPVAFGHVLAHGQFGPQHAVDAPKLAAHRIRTLAGLGEVKFASDGNGEFGEVRQQRHAARSVHLWCKQRGARLERREVRRVERATRFKRLDARVVLRSRVGERLVEREGARDLVVADDSVRSPDLHGAGLRNRGEFNGLLVRKGHLDAHVAGGHDD